MTDLMLESGEGILLQTTDVGRYDGTNELEVEEFYLTNKNLISVYEKSNGFFAKSETVVDKIPLTSICIANGLVQVEQVDDDDYGKSLQIIYTNGKRELFELNVSPKKEYPRWKEAISAAVLQAVNGTNSTIPPIPVAVDSNVDTSIAAEPEPKAKKSLFGALSGALNVDIQSVVEKAQSKIAEFPQQMAEKAQAKMEGLSSDDDDEEIVVSNIEEKKEGKFMFCSNCGTKLNEGAKFCHGCGSAVGASQAPATPPSIPHTPAATNSEERRQEYVGKILKCPNCGATITETTAICPDCGIQITGRAAVSSIQAFKEQLMAIENTRKGGLGGVFGVYAPANKSDIQKLSLIRNFPIPNSIDDCLEFMMLAIANIDVSLSKNTFANRINSNGQVETGATIGRTISNAWVAKMEQVYRKAEIVFPNDPAFAGIQKMYFDKMKELKIKVK